MTTTARNWFIALSVVFGLTACEGGFNEVWIPPLVPGAPLTLPPPPVPGATETRNYSLSDFSEIEIRDSFSIIVQQGDEFAIELTVDRGLGNLVAVDLDGERLRIGFRDDFYGDIRARTLEGVVTLPAISGIELDNSARAVLAGFETSFMDIRLNGSAQLAVALCHFDFVSAVLGGSSQLLLELIAPLPAAHVELSGSSRATLNLMAGGTLTGFASGSSGIDYYGSDISLDVASWGSASLKHLGDTPEN